MNVPLESEERGAEAGPSLRVALAEAGDRIQDLLDNAEDAAARTLEDAEARADCILQQAEAESRERGSRIRAADAEARPGSGGVRPERGRGAASARRNEGDPAGRLKSALDLVAEVVDRAELTAREADGLNSAASRLQAVMDGLIDDTATRTSLQNHFIQALRGRSGQSDRERDQSMPQPMGGTDAEERGHDVERHARETPASSDRGSAPPDSLQGASGEAQLLAIQMAVAGLNDGEIERRLRQQFDIDDADLALDVLRKLEAGRP